jgi:hypothetical protein
MPRNPIKLAPIIDTSPDIPDMDFVDQKIRELQQKAGPSKTKPKKSPKSKPAAATELWMGGPGVDTGDIRLT